MKIFISYSRFDSLYAKKLYNDLINIGLEVWMDKINILPGQNWDLEIHNAMQEADFIILLLSKKSIRHRGYFQKELKIAYEEHQKIPAGNIFFLPVRIDKCDVPEYLKKITYTDLFSNWNSAIEKIVTSINYQSDNFAIIEETNSNSNTSITEINKSYYSLDIIKKFEYFKQKFLFNKSKSKLKKYYKKITIPKGDIRNSIMVLGIEGSGKTTLIKLLLDPTSSHIAKLKLKNDNYPSDIEFSLYHAKKKLSNKKCHWIYVSDYKGDSISQLVNSCIIQQKQPFSPLAYDKITSIIFMVDFSNVNTNFFESYYRDELGQREIKRINEHNRQWNHDELSSICGLCSKELRHVCLFINKMDIMTDRTPSHDQYIIGLFDSLINRIKIVFFSVHFDVILGSTLTGEGFQKLNESLISLAGRMY